MPATLPTRKLGKNGPEIPAMGLGLMGLSAFYGATESDEDRFKVLDKAYELGELHWDSADIYGDSEDLVGKWFKRTGKRDEIFLATKFANRGITDKGALVDSSPEYAKQALEKSLKRLQTPYIDLYYVHRLNPDTPIELTVKALVEMKEAGKIKYIGLSEVSEDSLRRACAVTHIDAIQMEYSPFAMEIEDPQINVLKAARELGVAVVAYSPLGRGLLTGQIKSPADFGEGDFRTWLPRWNEENFPKNIKLVHGIEELAKAKGCTSGQLTLAWLLAQGDDILPIPGTKKIKYLEENLGALKINLTDAEGKKIRDLIEGTELHGTRYPESFISTSFVTTKALL